MPAVTLRVRGGNREPGKVQEPYVPIQPIDLSGACPEGSRTPPTPVAPARQQILSACEGTMRRLLNDRRYFARPTKALFTELRGHFPISEQLFVFQVVDRNVKLAIRYLEQVPAEETRAARRTRVQGAHAPRHTMSARAAAGPRLLPLPQAPRGGRRRRPERGRLARRSSNWSPEPPARCNGPVLLGVDVGGTFTDAVLVDGGRVHTAKSPTTPADQSLGVAAAIGAVLEAAGGRSRARSPASPTG